MRPQPRTAFLGKKRRGKKLFLESHPTAALPDLLHSSRLQAETAALPGYDAACTDAGIALLR